MSRKLHLLIAILTALQLTAAAEPAAKTVPKSAPAAEADDTDEKDPKPPGPTKPSPAEEKYWQAVRLSDNKDPAELAKARALLQSAADLEFPHAQTYLAECLMTGELGFPKDQRKAANTYLLAAERGNAWAQVSLGQCYYFGNGVRKNREKAAGWLERAVAEKADYTRPTPSEEFLAATANCACPAVHESSAKSAALINCREARRRSVLAASLALARRCRQVPCTGMTFRGRTPLYRNSNSPAYAWRVLGSGRWFAKP